MGSVATVSKISKLVPMLGSDRDGEIIAAVKAIDRTLRGAGHDWHDVVIWLEAGIQGPPMAEYHPSTHWQDLAGECLARAGSTLKPNEIDFLRSMASWPTVPSDKQAEWLDAIVRKLNEWCTA